MNLISIFRVDKFVDRVRAKRAQIIDHETLNVPRKKKETKKTPRYEFHDN